MQVSLCYTAEIVQAIDKLENKNSFGHDGISNRLPKFIKDEIISSLTLIVNQMITTGIFLDSFKKSKIIPLFKKGEPSLLVNYRPISLLPTISKIFERVIQNQMYDYFNDNNLLAEQQYGFRKHLSTEFAAVKLADYISKQMESGNLPCSLYIDLSKAFDTLCYDILLHKLRYYGFSGTELKLLRCYLRNREQYVKYNNYHSELIDISTGVPQGSILGPLLFSICINDLITVSDELNFIMYADDTTIYFNLGDFDPTCIETDITNRIRESKQFVEAKQTVFKYTENKVKGFPSKAKKCQGN